MSRCRHPVIVCAVWDAGWVDICTMSEPGCYDRNVCVTCGHWLPLGPATDTPETAVEVRAAELAQHQRDVMADVIDRPGIHWTGEENDGWQASALGWPVVPGCEAGWLAREIWTHEQETP